MGTMKSKTVRHLSHYLVLLIVCFSGLIAIIFTPHRRDIQAMLVGLIALVYFLWGILHHKIEKELNFEIIVEYLLFSLLGSLAVLSVLYYL